MEVLKFKPRGLKIQQDEKTYLISNGYSWCNKCESVHPISEFGKDKSNAYGFESICKECRRILAEQRRIDNPDRVREVRRNHRNKFADKYRSAKSEWVKENKDRVNLYRRERFNSSPTNRMQIICRSMVRRMFKTTGIKKCYKTQEVLGYSADQLKTHIESLFTEGMSWENYGQWHIDHIVPISSAKTLFDGIQLSQLSNLRPLWAAENLAKGCKLI